MQEAEDVALTIKQAPKDSSLLRNREARRQESVSSASTSSEDVPTPGSSITSPIDPRQSPKAASSKLRPLRLVGLWSSIAAAGADWYLQSRLVTPSPLSSAFPTSSSSGFVLDNIPDSPGELQMDGAKLLTLTKDR
jgi:hypothetical protein